VTGGYLRSPPRPRDRRRHLNHHCVAWMYLESNPICQTII